MLDWLDSGWTVTHKDGGDFYFQEHHFLWLGPALPLKSLLVMTSLTESHLLSLTNTKYWIIALVL